jgi:hypothetical protein
VATLLTVIAVIAAIGILGWCGPRALGSPRDRNRRVGEALRDRLNNKK